MLVAWLMRSRSSTATLESRGACRFSAARGCRFRRCSTTWKGERHSTSSSISSRRSPSNRHAPRSIWLGILFWPVRVLLDENLPRALAAELTGHEVSTVQAAGWSGTTNGELLRRAQGSFDVLLSTDRGSSAPAGSGCSSAAHRSHSSDVEPHGSSEAACGQHSEHSGIVAAWTPARGRRLTRRRPCGDIKAPA